MDLICIVSKHRYLNSAVRHKIEHDMEQVTK
eukprot:COSAG06_NODE_1927_length_8051_cov_7.015342_1_plen_31_part_00